jgi:hypothetical protein
MHSARSHACISPLLLALLMPLTHARNLVLRNNWVVRGGVGTFSDLRWANCHLIRAGFILLVHDWRRVLDGSVGVWPKIHIGRE